MLAQNKFILPTPNNPQIAFIDSVWRNSNTLFVGGWGGGKTVGGFLVSRKLMYQWEPGCDGAWVAPTYGTLEKSLLTAWKKYMPPNMYRVILSRSAPRIECYGVKGRDGKPLRNPPCIYLLSADSEISLESLNLAWIGADEVQGIEKDTWDLMAGRMRAADADKTRRWGLGLPESETWIHEVLETNPPIDPRTGEKVYTWIRGGPRENAQNLHPNYVPDLMNTLSRDMAESRIEGMFSRGEGYVYKEFDRNKHMIAMPYKRGLPIAFLQDFNNEPMTTIVAQYYEELKTLVCVDEIIRNANVGEMTEYMKEWCHAEGRDIDHSDVKQCIVVPDANSGNARQHAFGDTNIKVLVNAGFKVRAPARNPGVEDTDNEVKAALAPKSGPPKLLFNGRCVKTIESMGRLKYKGRKNSPYGHACDAVRYGVHHFMPINFDKLRYNNRDDNPKMHGERSTGDY